MMIVLVEIEGNHVDALKNAGYEHAFFTANKVTCYEAEVSSTEEQLDELRSQAKALTAGAHVRIIT